MTDSQLESAWQGAADLVGVYAMKSWDCPPSDEKMWRDKAYQVQQEQSKIQSEITRRSHI